MKSKNKSTNYVIKRVLVYAVLIIGGLGCLFPFIWMILTSFKNLSEALRIPPTFLPSKLEWVNYTSITQKIPFIKIYGNTIISAVLGGGIGLIISKNQKLLSKFIATSIGALTGIGISAYCFAKNLANEREMN